MRANDEIFEPSRAEGINFLPYSAPIEYVLGKDGNIEFVEFDKNLPQKNNPDDLDYKKTNQKYKMKVDAVI
jgi:NADPH-dependent glutamate synthase beta subunit-like oxidoreductase